MATNASIHRREQTALQQLFWDQDVCTSSMHAQVEKKVVGC